jgi:uncharacterized protein YndB with AHSA1/START domain
MPANSVSASTTIAAPPETVFTILADPRQHPRIDGSGTVRGRLNGPTRLELGSRFGMSMRIGAPYRIRNTVVEYDEDRLIAWRHFAPHRWRYELEQTDDGTRVTETWDLTRCNRTTRWFLGVLGYPKATARSIPRTLERLKEAAEKDVALA